MTEHRRPAIPFSDAPRGTCRWCGEAIFYDSGPHCGAINPRRRWHPACVDEYNLSDPREARRAVRKRDRGHCGACGLDTYKLGRGLKGNGRTPKLRELGFKPRKSLWELDHIVPLIDGGDHQMSNMQTLCVPCHAQKTADEARERARTRRACGADESPPAKETCAETSVPSRGASKRDLDVDEVLRSADATNQRVNEALAALDSARS